MPDKQRDLITEREAAELLGVARSTLNRWRQQGHAPPHIEYDSGTVRYERSALLEWQSDRVVPPPADHDRAGGAA